MGKIAPPGLSRLKCWVAIVCSKQECPGVVVPAIHSPPSTNNPAPKKLSSGFAFLSGSLGRSQNIETKLIPAHHAPCFPRSLAVAYDRTPT